MSISSPNTDERLEIQPTLAEMPGKYLALSFDLQPWAAEPDFALPVDATLKLAAWLKDNAQSNRDEALVVIVVEPENIPAKTGPIFEALYAAIKVMVNSVALERPQTRITSVRVTGPAIEAAEDLLEYLSSEAGSFVTATSIDLRSAA